MGHRSIVAISAINMEGGLTLYYQRKVQEAVPHRDKNKMNVINAVRNKVVKRIFACVRDKRNWVARRYEKNYVLALA